MISVRELTKVYIAGEVRTAALNGVNLDVGEGEFVAVMGPSGCGKSTLMNLLGLIDTPTSGSCVFRGKDVSRLGERARASLRKANIGFVFQNFNLIDELTVAENIELPLLYLGVPAPERKKRLEAILERLALVSLRNGYPRALSGGQQQRAAVARAVILHPRLILADEPTGNLDSLHGLEVMNLLTELNEEGTAVVMVTHSQEYAAFGSRLINLLDGRIVTEHFRGKRNDEEPARIDRP
jgi:putative ABC transport system ATP-binding protein